MPETAARLSRVYDLLLDQYGPQHWWPGDGPFEVMVGAVLTQSTNWRNVEKAIANLKAAGALNVESLAELPEARIAGMVRPSGYYNTKARKLKAMCSWLKSRFAGSMERLFGLDTAALRQELLGVYGIGEETADSIILYAAEKPIFVVDAYTRRITGRLGLGPADDGYGTLQAFFMENLPHRVPLFNEFHALLVRHGKDVCRKTAPRCPGCRLASLCPAPGPVTSGLVHVVARRSRRL
ncbi:MAG: endonuclease III domain-containing protein [Chloroflexi bacterium]|nr:endonuclease III domain-containing protein [Chloroflexota bacterium]